MMKKRLAAAAAIVLGGSLAAAQPATAAGSCTITGYTPTSVVLGLNPKSVKFDVKTSGCVEEGWSVDISGLPPSGWSNWFYAYDSDPYVTIEPYWDVENADAGYRWDAEVEAYDDSYDATTRIFVDSFVIKRATAISSFNASPEPVAKGRPITVKGLLRSASWDQGKYVPLRYAYVKVQFKRSGTSTWRTIKSAKSGSTGWVNTTVTAAYDGTWRLSYGGNSKFASKVTGGDYVDVR